MRRLFLLTALFAVMCVATSQAVVIYDAPNGGTIYAWNWTGGACITHTVTEVDYDGNVVIQHTGVINNTTGAAADSRFGSKWDFTVSGNTSADPADYTISFDIRNVSGDWDPIQEGLAIVTPNPAVGTDQYGHGFPAISVAQADGWVHVEFNLADYTNNWWQGSEWDLTQSTWSMEVGQPWPGESVADGVSFNQVWEMDNLKITMGSETEPYDPVVTPVNSDGTSGILISQSHAQATLHFKAAGDPNGLREPQLPVNPDVLGHYIYVSGGAADANLYLLDYVEQIHNADPYLTDPNVSYGPITLDQGTAYSWQVEEAFDDGTGSPYAAGDPNNTIWGPVWTFTTIAATPQILSGPVYAIADESGNASFTVTTGLVATDFRWFKVVGAQDTAENGETDDIVLTNSGIYSGTDTATLSIAGATVADEGQYYCIAYNGDPDADGIPSVPSPAAWLWIPRLVSYYPFEVMNDVEGTSVTPDTVGGFDMTMMSADTGTDVPVLGAGMPELAPDAYSLQFDNPAGSDPNSADGQYAIAKTGVADYADITISVWVYWNGGGVWQRIVDFGNNTDEYIFLTPSNGGEMRFAVKNVDEQYIATSPLPVDEWTLVTATLNGDTARLYVNGELKATGSITHDPIDFAPTLNYVGKSQWPDPYFNGMLDDLKIYNYARTTEQIAQDYLGVKGGWVCNNELYDLPYDFNGNCIVDLGDLAIFAGAWMDSYRIYPE